MIIVTEKEMEKMMRRIDRETGQSEWDVFEMEHNPSEFKVVDNYGKEVY